MTPELNAAEREAVERAKAWIETRMTDRDHEIARNFAATEMGGDKAQTAYGFACGYLAATADARERALRDAAALVTELSENDVLASAILALLRPASEKEAGDG